VVRIRRYGHIGYFEQLQGPNFSLLLKLEGLIPPRGETATYSFRAFREGKRLLDGVETVVSQESDLELDPSVRYAITRLSDSVKAPRLTYACPNDTDIVVVAYDCGIGFIRDRWSFLQRRARDMSDYISEALNRE
jgi:hypothetical protein